MKNSSLEFTPMESSASGSFLYVANHLSYKPWRDLNIYRNNELESTFIEIINPECQIFCCIYKHASMDVGDFDHF